MIVLFCQCVEITFSVFKNFNKCIKDTHATMSSEDKMTFAERYERVFEGYLYESLDKLRGEPSVTGDEVRAVIINLREYLRYHTRVHTENMQKKISNLDAAPTSAKMNRGTKNKYLCEIEQTRI